jgi:predicted amidohydrolase
MAKILIKNGRVWDGERFFDADVLTDGEQIAQIRPNIDEPAEFVYDADGKTVSAGLVDAHMHMRGLNKTFGIHAELSSIPFGVTAAADACAAYGDKALLDTFLLKNVVFVSAKFQNNQAVFDSVEKRLEAYGEKVVGIKVYFDTTVSDIQDIKPLREVVEFAEKKDLMIMVHSSNSPVPMQELLDTLRKGDIFTHAYHGGKNTSLDDDFEALNAARARGVIIDIGFAGHVHTDFHVLSEVISRGALPNVISTDVTRLISYLRGGRYGMTMCMSIARTLGMSEEDIFRSVTSSAANALKMGGEWGRLRVGGRADIAVLAFTDEPFSLTDNAGNTVKSDKGYKCMLTIADGEVVYRA